MTTTDSTTRSGSCDRAEVAAEHGKRGSMKFLLAFEKPRPPKPGYVLLMPESELLSAIRDARSKGKPNAQERTLLEAFGVFRSACLEYEATIEGNVLSLLRMAETFDLTGDEENAYRVLNFAQKQYGFQASGGIPHGWIEHGRIARKVARCRDVLSDALLMEGCGSTGIAVAVPLRPKEPEQVSFMELTGGRRRGEE